MIGLPLQVSPVCNRVGKPPLGEVKGSAENIPRSINCPGPAWRSAININQFMDSALLTSRGPPWWLKSTITLACDMIIQLPTIQCHIFMGEVAGIRLVPEPMACIALKGPP